MIFFNQMHVSNVKIGCSIKTPNEYINWSVPEGGGGPAYDNM
jgi:hypothetical protein